MRRGDADALLAELEAPEITIGGRTYRGRLLSFDEWERFALQSLAIARGEVERSDIQLFAFQFLRAVYPNPGRWRWWRSVAFQVSRLPWRAQMAVVEEQLLLQGKANGTAAVPREKPIPGKDSPPAAAAKPKGSRKRRGSGSARPSAAPASSASTAGEPTREGSGAPLTG